MDYATEAVLLQLSLEDRKWHSVIFYNKSLSLVKRNYKIYDKEILAIICMLEKWRHFLEEVRYSVEIWTDYKNLKYFMTEKSLTATRLTGSYTW